MVDIDIDALREENLKNVEVGVDGDTHPYFVDGIPYKSMELKDKLFNSKFSIPQGLRTRVIQENMNEDEKERMKLMAKMVDTVYERRREYDRPISMSSLRGAGEETDQFKSQLENRQLYYDTYNQDIGDYKLQDTGNDLTALFVNKEKKESVLAIRGLMPFEDYKDSFQLGEMIAYTFTETQNAENMGMEYKNDRDIVRRSYNSAKEQYPDHKMVVTGHSRGGKLGLHLGRENNIEYHAFSPAGNRADFIDSTPQRGGRLYYHTNDPVSLFHHKGKGKTEEQHYEMFNSRSYTHDLRDFYKNKQSSFYKHPVKPEQQLIEEEILIDMNLKNEDVPTAEEMVLSDMGIFEPLPSVYFDSLDPKKQNTNALTRDNPTERKMFNEYIPSVFTDINMKPPKPFDPITFDDIDDDGNNKITFEELKSYLLKRNYDENTIEDLFKTYDIDNDGSISRTEFNNLKLMV